MQLKHWLGFLSMTLLALAVASCVQPASNEIAPEVGDLSTFTVTPSPTSTSTVTPTTTPTDAANEDEEVETEEVETSTPVPTDTETATPTDAQSAFIAEDAAQEGATLVAQDDGQPIDPNAGADTTQGQDTTGGAQISDSQLTATAIIAGATSTQSFILTATAAGFGQGIATPTPTATTADLGTDLQPTNAPIGPTALPGTDCFHEVKAQDRSLYRLSLAYGVPINDIARASGIVNPDLIRVGQMLTIPGCGTTGGRPPATSTPNPAFGQGGAGSSSGGGLPANPTGDCTWGTSVIFPGGCPTTVPSTGIDSSASVPGGTTGTGGPGATTGSRIHTVAQGETLYEISLQYGVTMDAIASANGITNYDQITFNQDLVIP